MPVADGLPRSVGTGGVVERDRLGGRVIIGDLPADFDLVARISQSCGNAWFGARLGIPEGVPWVSATASGAEGEVVAATEPNDRLLASTTAECLMWVPPLG